MFLNVSNIIQMFNVFIFLDFLYKLMKEHLIIGLLISFVIMLVYIDGMHIKALALARH